MFSFFVFLLLIVQHISAHSTAPRPLKRIEHPTTHSLEILPRLPSHHTPNLPYKRNPPHPQSKSLRYSDTFRLTLSAFDETFHLHLRPNDHLIHPAARVKYYRPGADGKSQLAYTEPLVRESIKVYWGEVVVSHQSDARLLEDAAGVTPRPSNQDERGWARIIVHNQGDMAQGFAPVFEGAFSVDGNVHHVMTKENYLRTKHPLDPQLAVQESFEDFDSDLVVFRDSDVVDDDEKHTRGAAATCGHDQLSFNTDPEENPLLRTYEAPSWLDPFLSPFYTNQSSKRDDVAGSDGSSSNFIDSIGNSGGCPKTSKLLYMGVAADCQYTAGFGSVQNATTQILNDWNMASSLYKNTFNVSLGIVELQIQDATCPTSADPSIPWNVDCSTVTLNDRLSLFSDWRGQRANDSAGLWHLMSGCPTGTEVGIAWLGTLCQQSSSGTNPSVVSGTAVSTAGLTEWQVVAHEIGHNFGAIHDCTDGCNLTASCCPLTSTTCDANAKFIMSPVAGPGETVFSQCSLGNICSLMTANSGGAQTNTTCLIDADSASDLITLQMCGNGIVEAGEECDPGQNSNSTCCDAQTCQFTNGAVCDPDSSPCCTAQCSFAPSSTVCRAAKDSSCDFAEMCSGNSSSCPADKVAPNGQSCGSNGLACASGVCTSVATQCQTVGASMNLESGCPSASSSCQISCQDPTDSHQCIVLQTLLIDGSPCGYGGTCYSGNCQAGSVLDTVKAWFTSNKQISIPVTVVTVIVVLLLLWAFISTYLRCMRNRRNGYLMSTTPVFMAKPPTRARIPADVPAGPDPAVRPSKAQIKSLDHTPWIDETIYNGPRK